MLHQRVERHPGQFAIERRSNVGYWRKVTMEASWRKWIPSRAASTQAG